MAAEAFRTATGLLVPAITTEQMREVDRIAINEVGPNLYQTMENAGSSLPSLCSATLGVHCDSRRPVGHGTDHGACGNRRQWGSSQAAPVVSRRPVRPRLVDWRGTGCVRARDSDDDPRPSQGRPRRRRGWPALAGGHRHSARSVSASGGVPAGRAVHAGIPGEATA